MVNMWNDNIFLQISVAAWASGIHFRHGEKKYENFVLAEYFRPDDSMLILTD